MGFGTGLNAFLSAINGLENQTRLHYTAIDTNPLFLEEVAQLNYPDKLGHALLFHQLHQCNWNDNTLIHEFFTLEKRRIALLDFESAENFHLIYYDAFAQSAQPELWTGQVFKKMYEMLEPKGVLITYCSQGNVRRAMTAARFIVKKLHGPPGKREMLRAERLG